MLPRPGLKMVLYRVLRATVAAKSVRGYVTDYRVRLSQLVADNLNGEITAKEQTKLHRELIREVAEDTFIEGMTESGNFENEADAKANLEKRDKDDIARWIKEQSGFAAEFAQAVTDARLSDARTAEQNEAAQMAVLNRVDLWASALDTLGGMGRAVGNQNVMVTWKLGETEQHCQSRDGKMGCLELNGQKHRLKWFTSRGYIPGENGSEHITCGGWNCDCGLWNDKGEKIL